ncbi:MAG: ABC transporter ATP-binding protein [Anaerolineae bacterium]
MSTDSAATDRSGLLEADATTSIEGLHFRFAGAQRPALAGVDLEIDAGEFVVISGPSGCGKSTLALAIGGYLFQQYDGETEGRVVIGDLDVPKAPLYAVADIVGLVQQNPESQFCTLTVEDEVAFGLENLRTPRDEIRERIDQALAMVGAQHLLHRDLATLSGGEQQKIAVAAVMALRPRILILDEPTSNLDPTATSSIFDVIDAIRKAAGMTIIVIEHKLADLKRFHPRLITLEEGRVTYDGSLAGSGLPLSKVPDGDDTHRPITLSDAETPAQASAQVASTQDLTVRYGDRLALKSVDLEIKAGELISVMGDNGSGKTTLLHTLMGLRKPNAGTVKVLGLNTSETPVSQLAREIGFVFQNPDHQIFADTVWEEAIIAARNFDLLDGETQAKTKALLEEAGLSDRLSDHPYRLSYGEKRRLNLISVLSYNPRLLLLDEILIGQDAGNAAFLMRLIKAATTQGTAVVMVNHNPEVTAHYATRLIFMDGGDVLIDAAPDVAYGHLDDLGRCAYLPVAYADTEKQDRYHERANRIPAR